MQKRSNGKDKSASKGRKCPKCGAQMVSGVCPKCKYSAKTAYRSKREAKEFTYAAD